LTDLAHNKMCLPNERTICQLGRCHGDGSA